MKRVPMILLLIAPYVILVTYYQMPMDMTVPIFIYGALVLFNMVYAFLLPKLYCLPGPSQLCCFQR